MGTPRQERVAEALREEISDLISELKDPRIGFVSVTRVEVSNDLRYAKVYVSVLGHAERKQDTMKGLKSATGFLRSEVGKRIRLFRTPEIEFRLDESLEKGARVLELMDRLSGPTEDGRDG